MLKGRMIPLQCAQDADSTQGREDGKLSVMYQGMHQPKAGTIAGDTFLPSRGLL
jgi:hypothetical protein